MIFKQITEILTGKKRQTRRATKFNESAYRGDDGALAYVNDAHGRVKWEVGRTYAIVPKRGAKSIGRRIRITAIRQEQLHAITHADTIAEGVHGFAEYRELWERINGAGSWAQNPLVWVLEFELVP